MRVLLAMSGPGSRHVTIRIGVTVSRCTQTPSLTLRSALRNRTAMALVTPPQLAVPRQTARSVVAHKANVVAAGGAIRASGQQHPFTLLVHYVVGC